MIRGKELIACVRAELAARRPIGFREPTPDTVREAITIALNDIMEKAEAMLNEMNAPDV
jgi:hypothetical protein